jgi:ketosteroid isomerase-like protein
MGYIRLAEVSGGTFKLELHDVLANDDHAVALVTTSASRDDASFTARAAQVAHIRDGKLTESWFLGEDYAAADAFWG